MTNAIHPTALLVGRVELGFGNYVGPGAVITGPITIGNNNYFGPCSIVGGAPQDMGVDPITFMNSNADRESSISTILIGDSNVFREFVTIHHPLSSITRIGSNNYFMTYAHIPHDCTIEDGVKIANSTQIAGYSHIMSFSYLGLNSVVHQFTCIGSYAMIGMSSVVTKHVLPGSKSFGSPARLLGPNKIGLSRAGISSFDWWNEYADNSLGSADVPSVLEIEHARWTRIVERQEDLRKIVSANPR